MVVGSVSGATSGAVGVWNGTAIRLFQVKEVKAEGPSLMKPQGAVDAVGSNLVQRLGGLNLRGRAAGAGATGGVATAADGQRERTVREI